MFDVLSAGFGYKHILVCLDTSSSIYNNWILVFLSFGFNANDERWLLQTLVWHIEIFHVIMALVYFDIY